MKISFLISILFAITPVAHAMEMGPMGGQIADAGSFAFEVVADPTDQSFHIALLDSQKKNPTVKKSKIRVSVKQGKKTIGFNCSVMSGMHYHCQPKRKYNEKKKGWLILSGQRNGVKAKHQAKLMLPLGTMEMMHEMGDHDHHQ